MEQPVTFTVKKGIGCIELNRPNTSNTINMPLAMAFREAARAAANNTRVQAIVLTGAGERFCSGGDLSDITHADHPGNFLPTLRPLPTPEFKH